MQGRAGITDGPRVVGTAGLNPHEIRRWRFLDGATAASQGDDPSDHRSQGSKPEPPRERNNEHGGRRYYRVRQPEAAKQ